jgi:hypothetical protein
VILENDSVVVVAVGKAVAAVDNETDAALVGRQTYLWIIEKSYL